MPKRISPLALSRPEPLVYSRTFTDPYFEGATFPVKVKPVIDIGSETRRDEISGELTRLHVTGDAEWIQSEGAKGVGPSPVVLPAPDGAVHMPLITASLCFLIATLMVAETAAGVEHPWSFLEWVALEYQAPTAFKAITMWLGSLRADAQELVKNGRGASGAPSSDSPSTDAPAIIPSLSSAGTLSPV